MELKQYQLWQKTPTGSGKEYFYIYSTERFERYLKGHNIKYNLYKKYNIFEEQRKEIERLNHIINELEKYFDNELKNLDYRTEKLYTQGIHDTIIGHKYKLQELKENK